MYICICNALKEKDLRRLCKTKCPKDGESVIKEAGCKVECGQCLDYIDSFMLGSIMDENINNPSIA
ncbi:MAG: ferredoxin [Alphaproteobacteria bacterium CG11_big_fil_rev_8_21_14_0_20_39_49]|nr:MAG: ferredoxin [Alphaproteobacteria bacterium CG11_big_fil_rev_8_21_14_0_20_39_49]